MMTSYLTHDGWGYCILIIYFIHSYTYIRLWPHGSWMPVRMVKSLFEHVRVNRPKKHTQLPLLFFFYLHTNNTHHSLLVDIEYSFKWREKYHEADYSICSTSYCNPLVFCKHCGTFVIIYLYCMYIMFFINIQRPQQFMNCLHFCCLYIRLVKQNAAFLLAQKIPTPHAIDAVLVSNSQPHVEPVQLSRSISHMKMCPEHLPKLIHYQIPCIQNRLSLRNIHIGKVWMRAMGLHSVLYKMWMELWLGLWWI